jgi:tocopherol O-methyltransferase
MPHKDLVFQGAAKRLKAGGHLVSAGGQRPFYQAEPIQIIADWFKRENATQEDETNLIKPIEVGMLLPPLSTPQDYVSLATQAGFKVLSQPRDISKQVARTWDISLSLVTNPAIWKLAWEKGPDVVAFLKAFQAMRTGYSSGAFQYHVMSFVKTN